MLKTSVVILFSVVLLGTVSASCPPDILTRPCKCTQTNGNTLRCENITDVEVLKGVFKRTGTVPFITLDLANANIESIPSRFLTEKQIKNILIADSNFTTLFDSQPPPRNNLQTINLKKVHFQDPFPWNQFKPLNKLILFTAIEVKIPVLDNSFKNNVNKGLMYLVLLNTSTSHIGDGVLKEFKNLSDLIIQKNLLTTFKRNYLPRPSNIVMIRLDGNQIKNLSSDTFSSMPRLQHVDLSNNELSRIPNEVFSQINHRLSNLILDGNPLNCDCGFGWLISNKPKYEFKGTCAAPEKLKGKSVKDLNSSDIGSCH